MIAYFSGTGNSLLVARMLQELTGDEMVSIAEMVGSGGGTLESNKPVVIVSPIYAWKIPRFVEEFIVNTEFSGSSMVYFVMTCGGDAGFNSNYVKTLCSRKGIEFMGEIDLTMPDNYIIMDDPPGETEAREMIRNIVPVVRDVADKIANGERIDNKRFSGMFKTYIVNPLYYKFSIDCEGFTVGKTCDSCGKCVNDCPVGCISLVDGRPEWKGSCVQCLSCINRCPKTAIEYKSRTKGKRRYVCPFGGPEELL